MNTKSAANTSTLNGAVEGEAEAEITESPDNGSDGSDDSVADDAADQPSTRGTSWSRVVAFGILPGMTLVLALAAAYLKWEDGSWRDNQRAATESVEAASTATVAILSYRPDTVDQQLTSARDLLTGQFLDSYTSLTNDVVIPGSKEQQISTEATVPAAASVSAVPSHAVVLVFVNQVSTVGSDAPSGTSSSVRVTMDKVAGRWLVSGFDPV